MVGFWGTIWIKIKKKGGWGGLPPHKKKTFLLRFIAKHCTLIKNLLSYLSLSCVAWKTCLSNSTLKLWCMQRLRISVADDTWISLIFDGGSATSQELDGRILTRLFIANNDSEVYHRLFVKPKTRHLNCRIWDLLLRRNHVDSLIRDIELCC